MPKVAFLTFLAPELANIVVDEAPPGFDVTYRPANSPEEELVSLVEDSDFLIIYGESPSERVMKAANKVRLIQLLSAGYDNWNFKLSDELGVSVCTNAGANSHAVAEHTVALILAIYKRLVLVDAAARTGQGRGTAVTGLNTFEVAEKTVGIVGLGNIGKKVAQRLASFEAKLLYADTVSSPEMERQLGIRQVSLEELLQQSDIVTLHVPLLQVTRHMIGSRELGLMKSSAIIINTCRGPVVDEEALIEALDQNSIAGAGLDVFEKEPLPGDSPLTKMENVVLSGHTAGTTYDTFFRRARFAYENFQAVMDGNEPMSVVRPD